MIGDIDVAVPITGGLIRLQALRELVEVLDDYPENVLVEVRPDELRFIERCEP